MNLEDIGYNSIIDTYVEDNGLDKSNIGRVIAVYKDRYLVRTDSHNLKSNITGNLQYSIDNQTELPVVGDWVHLRKFDNSMALITDVLPRHNFLERRAVGKRSDSQLIASNIDYGLIIEAITENFNLNRIERYITICNSANVSPVLLLTKTDLIKDLELEAIIDSTKHRIASVPLFAISNVTKVGINGFKSSLIKGRTYCLLGLSGVGKSTLINNLMSKKVLKTSAISESTKKGVHTTSHRQLFLINGGSIFIDNPGMREVGVTDATNSLEVTFDKISNLAESCHFNDCTHTHEKDCAVLIAIEKSELEQAAYENYLKMKKEQFHYQATLAEKKKRDKTFGKMIKTVMKNKKSEKFV
ncbi:MAG: ribosome small subunit-dependent GTPase A [Candidatus Neomarinimicrobiota bacterium]